MRRTSIVLLVAVMVSACSSDSGSTSTTTTSATTSTAPTTTTTESVTITGEGVDDGLIDVVQALYADPGGSSRLMATQLVKDALAQAISPVDPGPAVGHVARTDDGVGFAVVETDDDVTLAVADPDWRVVGGWWPSMGIGEVLGDFPKIIAVIGSDARPDENREHTRADSIHFIGLDGSGAAGVVGVPRDSWVPIPGSGNNKINASLSIGGPELMMETFSDVSGLEFDGYLLTGFAGFQGLIGVLGGLRIDVPYALNDKAAKAYLDAGEQVLAAGDALAFARVRKTLSGGDFTRQENGGLAIIAAAAMIRANGVASIPQLLVDSDGLYSTDMSPDELFDLTVAIAKVQPDQVVNVVASGGTGTAGGASVVFLHDSAYTTFTDLVDGVLETD